jgi:hypothetical protein
VDKELVIVFMQAANNMVQFPEGISTCALFISWFCYVRYVEVEEEISNKSYRRGKSYQYQRVCVCVCVCVAQGGSLEFSRGNMRNGDIEYCSSLRERSLILHFFCQYHSGCSIFTLR